jgi:uncharacterized protein (DUF1697 family)
VALVVLLRGVNVGGHRTFRPTVLARQLSHLDAVNIGAAGTLVIRRPVTRAQLRDELACRLPFATRVMICPGGNVLRLVSRDYFSGVSERSDVVRFVSVLARNPRTAPPAPLQLPPTGRWQLRVLARDRRYLVGVYRRRMKAIGILGTLDRVFGVPATTRGWSTMNAIARVLGERR